MPAAVRERILEVSRLGVKALLIRRHGRLVSPSGCQVFTAWAGPGPSWIETARLHSLDELCDIDLTPVARGERPGLRPHEQAVVCVCTHGRHDTCCAELGRPLAAILHRSHPGLVWEVSHIGGDRFAGNLLILPDGLYYGRVSPESAASVVGAHEAGRIDLDHLRGRSSMPVAAQAAEVFLRRRLGELRIEAVSLVEVTRVSDRWSVTFDVCGVTWLCIVGVGHSDAAQLTCAAVRLSPAPTFTEIDIRRVA